MTEIQMLGTYETLRPPAVHRKDIRYAIQPYLSSQDSFVQIANHPHLTMNHITNIGTYIDRTGADNPEVILQSVIGIKDTPEMISGFDDVFNTRDISGLFLEKGYNIVSIERSDRKTDSVYLFDRNFVVEKDAIKYEVYFINANRSTRVFVKTPVVKSENEIVKMLKPYYKTLNDISDIIEHPVEPYQHYSMKAKLPPGELQQMYRQAEELVMSGKMFTADDGKLLQMLAVCDAEIESWKHLNDDALPAYAEKTGYPLQVFTQLYAEYTYRCERLDKKNGLKPHQFFPLLIAGNENYPMRSPFRHILDRIDIAVRSKQDPSVLSDLSTDEMQQVSRTLKEEIDFQKNADKQSGIRAMIFDAVRQWSEKRQYFMLNSLDPINMKDYSNMMMGHPPTDAKSAYVMQRFLEDIGAYSSLQYNIDVIEVIRLQYLWIFSKQACDLEKLYSDFESKRLLSGSDVMKNLKQKGL